AGGPGNLGGRPGAGVEPGTRRVGLVRARLGGVLASRPGQWTDDGSPARLPQGHVGRPRVGAGGLRRHPRGRLGDPEAAAHVPIWDVFGKRKPDDEFEWVGSIKASDLEMALVLARETHFRHKEGVAYAVRGHGEQGLHVAPYGGDEWGGVADRAYGPQ